MKIMHLCKKIYVLPSCRSCLHTQGTTTCGGQNTHIWATSAWDSLYSSTILEYTHFFSSLEWTCNIIFGIVQHVFCNQILYSQLLFHTESYNNFFPGATIHLCKQTQISLLTVDYWKDRHLNLSNCITLHNLLSESSKTTHLPCETVKSAHKAISDNSWPVQDFLNSQ